MRRRPILVGQVAAGVSQPIKPSEEGIALRIETVLGCPSFTNTLSLFCRESDNALNYLNGSAALY
jgi:hypothetical protein